MEFQIIRNLPIHSSKDFISVDTLLHLWGCYETRNAGRKILKCFMELMPRILWLTNVWIFKWYHFHSVRYPEISVPRRQTWKFKTFHDSPQILKIRFLNYNKNLLTIELKKVEELTELLCYFLQQVFAVPSSQLNRVQSLTCPSVTKKTWKSFSATKLYEL